MVEPIYLKNIWQIGSFAQVVVKINNIWNHHLANYLENWDGPPTVGVYKLWYTGIPQDAIVTTRIITIFSRESWTKPLFGTEIPGWA